MNKKTKTIGIFLLSRDRFRTIFERAFHKLQSSIFERWAYIQQMKENSNMNCYPVMQSNQYSISLLFIRCRVTGTGLRLTRVCITCVLIVVDKTIFRLDMETSDGIDQINSTVKYTARYRELFMERIKIGINGMSTSIYQYILYTEQINWQTYPLPQMSCEANS